jgi:acetyl esterase/lipase
MRRSLLAALGGALVSACSPLGALNAANRLTPGDGGVERLAEGVAYGPAARQRLDVWAPRAQTRALPVVLFFYGGSWSSGAREDYAFAARAIAARGFVVVVPDYRLVPDVEWPAFVEDGAAAVAWTRREIGRHGGDPARVAVAGHSAGAYIAVTLALDPRWLRAAGTGPVGAAAGLAGPYDFHPFTSAAASAAFGRAPDPAATQPVNFARADAPPLWLASGTDDTTVRPRNSERLAATMRAVGGRAEVRLYPHLGHVGILLALSKPFRGKAPVLGDMAAFLARSLGA